MAYYLKQMYFVFSGLKPTAAAKWTRKTEAETMRRPAKITSQRYYRQEGGTTAGTPRPQTRSRGGTTAKRQRYYRQVPGSGSTAGGTGTGTREAPKRTVYLPVPGRYLPRSTVEKGFRTIFNPVLPLGHGYYRCCSRSGTTAGSPVLPLPACRKGNFPCIPPPHLPFSLRL